MSATYADNNDIKKIVSLCDEVEELLKQKKIIPRRYRIPHRNSNGKQESYYPKTHSDYQQLNSSFVETTGNVLKVETIETHREIATAIAQHNAIKAQDAMTMHLMYNRRCINSKQNL